MKKNNEEYPIIFIHGIAAGHEKWRKLGKKYGNDNYFEIRITKNGEIKDNYKICDCGRQVWNMSYYTENPLDEGLNGTLEKYAHRVDKMIEKIKEYSRCNKVVIIAHSMGGLVSRRYMSTSAKNYNNVHKIVTVATPHEGERAFPPMILQVRDLQENSLFIQRLNASWSTLENVRDKWGVVGAVDAKNILNKKITGASTDSAGPGFVTIRSAIPFGEWERALKEKENVIYDSPYFGYLVLVNDTHNNVLRNKIIEHAIEWAVN